MNTHKRRCHSEQIPVHVRQAIPPHKAAKLRQAQLCGTQQHLLTQPDVSRSIRIEASHKDEKEVVPQSRHSSAPVHSHRQNHYTSEVPLNPPSHSSRKLLRQEQQRERISNQFPSIATVIAEPKDRDTRRKLGEKEFYEYTGDDGIVRRRSMMRTVDKDDFLVARGANPRTGLITPDWNSVASSLDNDHTHAARRDRPSAQWKLDGDAWISVPPEDDPVDSISKTNAGMDEPDLHTMQANAAQIRRNVSGGHPTTALTEQNLRTFSDQIQPESIPHHDFVHNNKTAGENKIRRKPVGSPGVLPVSKGLQGRVTRNVSGDTIIHSPDTSKGFVPEQLASFQYFSPESVGKGLSRNDATNFPQRARNGSPFLGLPVESRDSTLPTVRGFTSKIVPRDQLQQLLRTSSGPYPSHLSSQPPMLIKASQSLHTLQDQHVQYRQHADLSRGQRCHHQPVQRAYLPDAMLSSDLTQLQCQLRDYQGSGLQTGKAQPRPGGRPVVILEEDHRSQDFCNDPHTQRVLRATPLNTQMREPASQRQPISDALSRRHDHILPKPGTYSHQDHMPAGSMKKMPKLVADHHMTSTGHLGHMDGEPMLGIRPQLGSRAQEMLHIPKIRVAEIDTALKVLSNTTGMDAAHVGEGGEDVGIQELIEDPELNSRTRKTPLENASRAIHFLEPPNVNKTSPSKPSSHSLVVARRHSVCCPECCTESDCHDGCLGHPSPNASVVDSETSSIASMGIFDTNFETSVKAVNMALLTPSEKSDGKLAKIRTALGWRSGASSPTRSPQRASLTTRTLRNEPLSQKVNIGLIRHPQQSAQRIRESDTTHAKAAAIKAQGITSTSQKLSGGHEKAQNRVKSKDHAKRKTKEDKNEKIDAPPEANKGRRVSGKIRKVSKDEGLESETPTSSDLRPMFAQPEPRNEATDKDESTGHGNSNDGERQTLSMLDRMSSFIRESCCSSRPKGINIGVFTNPVLLSHLRSLLIVFKDMTVTVADTTSVIVEVALEYNKSGNVVLPAGINASEVAGNVLRSVLYLMITACVYALCVKSWRMTLAVLRVVLLPVRICAWIIG